MTKKEVGEKMKSKYSLPCIDCLIFPVCKTSIERNKDLWHALKDELMVKCNLVRRYVLQDTEIDPFYKHYKYESLPLYYITSVLVEKNSVDRIQQIANYFKTPFNINKGAYNGMFQL